MFTAIKTFLLSRKFLATLAFLALIFAGGWYVNGTRQENIQLQQQVETLRADKARIAEELNHQVETLKTTVESYDEMMSVYVNATYESQQLNRQLSHQLETLDNEELRSCMRTRVDREFLDSVFNYPTNPRQQGR